MGGEAGLPHFVACVPISPPPASWVASPRVPLEDPFEERCEAAAPAGRLGTLRVPVVCGKPCRSACRIAPSSFLGARWPLESSRRNRAVSCAGRRLEEELPETPCRSAVPRGSPPRRRTLRGSLSRHEKVVPGRSRVALGFVTSQGPCCVEPPRSSGASRACAQVPSDRDEKRTGLSPPATAVTVGDPSAWKETCSSIGSPPRAGEGQWSPYVEQAATRRGLLGVTRVPRTLRGACARLCTETFPKTNLCLPLESSACWQSGAGLPLRSTDRSLSRLELDAPVGRVGVRHVPIPSAVERCGTGSPWSSPKSLRRSSGCAAYSRTPPFGTSPQRRSRPVVQVARWVASRDVNLGTPFVPGQLRHWVAPLGFLRPRVPTRAESSRRLGRPCGSSGPRSLCRDEAVCPTLSRGSPSFATARVPSWRGASRAPPEGGFLSAGSSTPQRVASGLVTSRVPELRRGVVATGLLEVRYASSPYGTTIRLGDGSRRGSSILDSS